MASRLTVDQLASMLDQGAAVYMHPYLPNISLYDAVASGLRGRHSEACAERVNLPASLFGTMRKISLSAPSSFIRSRHSPLLRAPATVRRGR